MSQNKKINQKNNQRFIFLFFIFLEIVVCIFLAYITIFFLSTALKDLSISLKNFHQSVENSQHKTVIVNLQPVEDDPSLATTTINVLTASSSAVIASSSATVIPVVLPGEQKKPDNIPGVASGTPLDLLDVSLFFGSFVENFSGTVAINSQKTTLYQDETATALYFPPNYSLTSASSEIANKYQAELDKIKVNNFSGPYSERRCLASNCLEIKDKELFYNDQRLTNPIKDEAGELVAISLGSLETKWLVGFTIKKNNGYIGQVFYFNGDKFTPLNLSTEIQSPYFGLFGFGGTDNDFLIIYGAYQGIAYHLQNNQAVDISRFFDIRVMNGGFKAEIIKIGTGLETTWYIFSTTSSQIKLIKLWQNKTPAIVGEAVFSGLFPSSAESVVFKFLVKTNEKRDFLVKVKEGNKDTYSIFSDRGFKNQTPLAYYSLPIAHDGDRSQVVIKKIATSWLELDPASLATTKFSFSADGKTWREISSLDPSQANLSPLRQYFLRVILPRSSDRFSSPFLASVLFNYYCQK